ncbi:mavicyanin [Prosopis cineraria]|uniref:mavicyanin n=1 Tax=Prosopis cineraria TaxID=364024 RepID=UPI00240F2C01|nr:mavicyanin [Prosopis cineraria]
MGMVERGVVALLMVVAMAALEVSYGAVYKVGDSAGWTTIGNINYKKWSATKNFQVGDTIIFEYNSQFHNVMRVTHEMYKSCNASSPLATFSTGKDSIVIQNHGHHFFFCGVPGHCQAGQKVDINVPKVSATSEAPTPSALASPTVSVPNNEPAPSPNQAASIMVFAFKERFAFLGLSIALLFACP